MKKQKNPDRAAADRQLDFFRYMTMAREFDAAMLRLYRQGKAFGGVYSQLGNEAVSVGSAMALEPKTDVLFPMHRNVGAHFVFGTQIDQMMQNQLARQGSQMRGTDGTGHYADPALRIYGNVSHLGSMIPVANGFVLAARMRGEPTVALTYIGDGGAQVGEVHEALNFASVQKLPLVLIIENNQYAYSTPNSMEFAVDELSKRAIGYGIHGETIDGTDVELVYETCRKAVERAREGNGPSIIETRTMRMRGHAEHDDFSYVPKDLLDQWALKDPVNTYAAVLVQRGVLTGETVKQIHDETFNAMVAAIDRTLELPWPDASEGMKNVFL
ncbi:MAG: thiamine pyrophosphate-dependent dehydrogenase E1 component subunit alpha [Flavobacteriales bacterium]|nr:MAG: thiamine pyrophosphate-dependent dehydrogenase E1 component subunit alpha [Bacteroidota bacterium]KXK35068.1 MAG: 2-oxoisovalerate dehydrogenase E1 component [Chlorobi bacterium OLB6]MBE2265580.1 thiamine pyrophosphate-dependent dehydrogenase E1 component subunit alpha [Flavobacteriales bacterium]MBW7853918.1 thiamine pyrophosphate-dependent dehydrogenase E1 component subunit alpha [Candidatus Kapabacteria bacterium]MCL4277351.1 thiamine pyrophosphate-dependent dehydrogenase E1 componen